MDLAQIRRIVIIAMFSDDELFEKLALKGGNALSLVYRFGSRVSVDIDLSLADDFTDIENAKQRIFRALQNRFNEVGLTVFDETVRRRPVNSRPNGSDRLGGYEVTFKLMESVKYSSISDKSRRQRESLIVGPLNQRIFKIQISKYEFCTGKREAEFDDYTINVYTPEMIVIEKLRAICQQMREYGLRGHKVPRARDFYDIHSVIIGANIDLTEPKNLQLARDVFGAKNVPLVLIAKIVEYREFHRQDWPAVQVTVSGTIEAFDFYFDFVLDQVNRLKSLWEENPP